MKKIIATVLAMVMALALCTVAFAADQRMVHSSIPTRNKHGDCELLPLPIAVIPIPRLQMACTVAGICCALHPDATAAQRYTDRTKLLAEANADDLQATSLYKDGAVYKYLVAADDTMALTTTLVRSTTISADKCGKLEASR